MFSKILPLLVLISLNSLTAQWYCSPKDSALFHLKMKELSMVTKKREAFLMTDIGQTFLDQPYVEKTLEIGERENLVINLRGFDCTTYVENVLAFGLMLEKDQDNFESFAKNLETIRYRNGKLDGYPSRLHYFTEWIRNNEQKGLMTDITSELGGVEQQKAINFMGTHRSLYPFLSDDQNFADMLEVEKDLANESLCILSQSDIARNENQIQSGDIIALATSIKGLDVTHTGFAVQQNGRIHLLHASSSGSVQITKEPLVDYLKKIKNNIGIIVARPTLFSP